jgi:alkaline phosphatase
MPPIKTSNIIIKDSDISTPKNIIFMIVDGMGFEYVKAARIYNGQVPLRYENFPCKTSVTTCAYEGSLNGEACIGTATHVTDSAASATAIATGHKVSNGVLSKNIPGNNTDIKTILELAKERHQSTGIISTSLFTDATPAAFAAHANGRGDTEDILESMFNITTPNIIFGADTTLHKKYAKDSKISYDFVDKISSLNKLAEKISKGPMCDGPTCAHIYGGFGNYGMIPGFFEVQQGLPLEITPTQEFAKLGVPHLREMTAAALKILSKNTNGFFLMVESSLPDIIGHHNKQLDESEQTPSAIAILVREMLEVENTISVLQTFVAEHPDTLVILTADHETGGLVIEDYKTDCLGESNCLASVRWTSTHYDAPRDHLARHTNARVPLYALGAGSQRFCQEKINNTDIIKLALPAN